ncbi:restriction endonuclease subunit S [Photobacterium alginatilyticum]|uniref:Restriction endonuclease subunit S n=1 Tax=Photobacterium alginatilyticum TaxID=1775171 RepID=A0ABW9YJX3_9GAMM|nr:restriction endonuclease subunit S [Photobacterium alginatilyticum]NBI53831.1 restriction endonuclease subunit S [Photobacterium alginatilyticum]
MSWPLVKLGDVAPSKPIKSPIIKDSSTVWQLNLDKVESQSGKVIDKLYAPVEEAGSSTHWFDERHVLYSKLRPYLNKVVLPDEQGVATTELVPMLPDQKRLDRKYLTYYLRSNRFVSWISDQVAGAKMPRVSMKVFWEHEIPLPPLEEQKRVVAILDKADAIRQKRKQAIDLADEFLRSVFLDMFGDPVTNPKGWEVRALKDLAKIQIGPFGSQLHKEDYITGGIPLINPTHIVDGKLRPNDDLTLSKDKFLSLSQYHLQDGDIVMGRRGEMGRCAVIRAHHGDLFCGTGSLYIRPKKNGFFSDYLYSVLTSQAVKDHLISESQGATMPNLNKTIVGNIEVPIPSDGVVNRFVAASEKFASTKQKMNSQELNVLFGSLSQKAFAGEL